jgi:hypothetical protein
MLEHFELAQVQKIARNYGKIGMSRDDFDDGFEHFNKKKFDMKLSYSTLNSL